MTPEEKEFSKKLNSLVNDTPKETSIWNRMVNLIRRPSEAQRLGMRAFSGEFFSLLLRSVSPFAAFHKSALASTFGLQQVSGVVNSIKNNLTVASNINIYSKTIDQLTTEVSMTMPEVEREMKSRVLEKNMNSIANSLIDFVHSKFRKYSSYVGVAGSTIAIASLNPWLLPLGVPAYLMEKYLSRKRRQIQKTVFPHEFRARMAVWNQQDKSIRNPEVHFITADKTKQAKQLQQAQKDLFEVSEIRRKRQMPLILLSAGVTTVLTGVALASGWGTMTLPALVGTYAATNAFLGSIQSWVMSSYHQQEVLRDVLKNYNEIRHQPEFDLQTGKQKLPDHVDTIYIDRIQYKHRKKENSDSWKRQEKPVLDFSTDFFFKPGINVLGGVSGAGKTTLYKLMRHADDLSRGSISVGHMKGKRFVGEKLTDLSLEDANQSIAFSLPELRHIENITAVELIKATNPKLSHESLKEIADLFAIPLWEDKERKKEKYLSNMSSGEKKRVLCVSALVSPKKILVLDEPTSGLDPMNVDRILDAINLLGTEKTIIYTTHHPEELRRLNVANIIDLEQRKSEEGEILPTDVKIYPCETEKDKENYIHLCRHREPEGKKAEVLRPKKTLKDILLKNSDLPQETEWHRNVFVKQLLESEGTAHAACLHEVVVRRSSPKRSLMQKLTDKLALQSMKSKADSVRHKRLFKALNNPDK